MSKFFSVFDFSGKEVVFNDLHVIAFGVGNEEDGGTSIFILYSDGSEKHMMSLPDSESNRSRLGLAQKPDEPEE